jgi:hypothetical protein
MTSPWIRFAGLLGEDLAFVPLTGWETRVVAQPPPSGDGVFVVEGQDGSGNVLVDVEPEVRFDRRRADGTREALVVAYLPLMPGLRRLRLRRRAFVLYRRDVAAAAPRVLRVTAELTPSRTLAARWTAEPGAGAPDPLIYRVVWVAEGRGAFPLSRDLSAPGFEIPVARLPGSPRGRVAVLASDGVRSGYALSEPLAVPLRPARVAIVEPHPQAVFPPGQPVTVRGVASDDAGRRLDAEGLTWSLDGQPVAADTSLLLLRGLAPGEHQVSLSWEGAGAPRGEARMVFRVASSPTAPGNGGPPPPEPTDAPTPIVAPALVVPSTPAAEGEPGPLRIPL